MVSVISDKEKRLSQKAVTIIACVLFVLVIDNIVGFSYYYNNSQKLTQVTQIGVLLKDSTLSKNDRLNLVNLRENLISHQSIKDWIWLHLSNIPSTNNDNKESVILNPYINFFTSTWFVLLVMISTPLTVIKDNKNKSIPYIALVMVLAEFMLYVTAWLLAKGSAYIPVIFNQPLYNYILNCVINIGLAYLAVIVDKKYKF